MAEEFQEADVMWPDPKPDRRVAPDAAPPSKRWRSSASKASAPLDIPRGDDVSRSWTLGFAYFDSGEDFDDDDVDDGGGGGGGGEEMVPPHVLVGRRMSEKMAFSVCTGNGRTLKGRDLRRVRNSILRMTGFLER